MTFKTTIWLNTCTNLLIVLWGYAALSKLMEFDKFRHQLFLQFLNKSFSDISVYLIPGLEISLVLLMITEPFRKGGLILSLILLSTFTIYIGLILLKIFPRKPCSCGGVLELLDWGPHFLFNLFFLFLNINAIILLNNRRKEETHS